MSIEEKVPEISRRIQSHRFPSLQKIDWRKERHLDDFIEKLSKSVNELKFNEARLQELFLDDQDLRSIFIDISLVVSRINEDGLRLDRRQELFDIALSRKWTSIEKKEINDLDFVVSYLLLDVRSLIVFLLIFMDKLARFLALLIKKGESKLRSKSFYYFQRDLAKLKGKEIEEFSQLIKENSKWFAKLKELRDDFVEHHPAAGGAISFENGEANIALTTRKKTNKEPKFIIMGSQAKKLPIREVDEILLKFKELLRSLSDYLCSNFETLPIEVE